MTKLAQFAVAMTLAAAMASAAIAEPAGIAPQPGYVARHAMPDSDGWTIKTLKEFVFAMRAEDEKRLADYKAGASKALELQAQDYKEHFLRLNNSYDKAEKVASTYLTITAYAKDQEQFQELRRRVESELSSRQGGYQSISTLIAWVTSLGLLVSVIINILTFMTRPRATPATSETRRRKP